LLNHPFIVGILNEEEKIEVYKLENEIRQKNKIFQQVSAIQIPVKLKPIFNFIYEPWKNDWKKAVALIRQLNHSIHPMLSEKEGFEKAVLEGFDAALNDFQNCVEEGFPEMSLRSFKVLFNQQWTKDSIAYYGNPIEGLQIMGLLETRLLDFETILVLGLNEGKMPPTNLIQTMIPMDLRRFFQLPTNREKQGLFAHHFYRLLHHCKRMHITYANSNEGIVTNEASRYLMQLELELSRLNPAIQFTKRDYTLSSDHSCATEVVVEKTDAVIERMEELFASGTSASAIKTFLACPLDFYYKYVLKFGEEKKVEEEVESSTFGTFIHETLEELYAPFSKRNKKGLLYEKTPPVLHVEDVDKMLNDYELIMRKKFSVHFNNDPNAYEKGKNFLSFSMALELTKRFLEKERKFILENGNKAYRIEALEQEFIHEMKLNIHGKNLKVKLKGFADRIDSIDDSIRIIDYKTGKVKKDDVGKNLARFNGTQVDALVKLSKDSSHFFQLMTYMYLYYQRYQVIPSNSAIISFVNLNESPFALNAGDGKVSNKEIIELFPSVFSHLLDEIFERSTPFTHKSSSHVSYCRYC
jgi:ATP-dependent helicase/nuclease subunit B